VLLLEELLASGSTDEKIARQMGKTVTAVRMARKNHRLLCRRRLIMTLSAVVTGTEIRETK